MKDVKKWLNSPSGESMKDFLLANLNDLKNIENIDEKGSLEEQALETKAQKRAYNKLKSIFEEILTMSAEQADIDKDGYTVE